MYAEHCQNLREVENGIERIELDLRKYISMNDSQNEYSYTKILSQLITCWAEVRILKVLHEPGAFTQFEIYGILPRTATLQSKWEDSVKLAFVKGYGLNNLTPIETQLSGDTQTRYLEIINLISNDMLPSIQLRNRIAHGQWRTAFTGNLRSISIQLTQQIADENIVSLQLKKKILLGMALIIHDLAVSPPTFERDFDQNYQLVSQNKTNLHKRDYADYKTKMVAKYQRGLQKRRLEENKMRAVKKESWIYRSFKNIFYSASH